MPSAMTQKTHPMVLVAAVALTIFSLLGSAAITGLLPEIPTGKKEIVLIPPPETGVETIILHNSPRQEKQTESDQYKSKIQPKRSAGTGVRQIEFS